MTIGRIDINEKDLPKICGLVIQIAEQLDAGTGAPVGAEYVTSSANATLTAERVLTNTASITWDFTTPGQAKANTAAGGGNVSNSGTPTVGQYAKWVTATTIQGVSTATVLSDIGAQPIDADLTAIAALAGTNTIYYRSAANTWTAVTIGTNLTFAAGTLDTAVTPQPLDADLTAIAALAGTNTIYYRSAANTWTAVTIGAALSFAGGTLNRAALTGDVTASAGSNATTIPNNTVTYAKMQDVSAASLLIGRGSSAGAGDPQEITLGANLTMTGTTLSASTGGGSASPGPPQGRLTLQTLTPVMTTTQAAKTTIFYTPYVGNQVPIWDGSTMTMTAIGELSNITTDSATGSAGPAAVAASSVYDLFVWAPSGTPTLTRGPAWTNDTTRSAGTALTMVNGVLLNNASITNGPAASRGTYVGTIRSNGSSQLDWIYGGLAAGGTAGFFGLWNAYNRRAFACTVGETTDSWTYGTATWRQANAAANMRVSFVRGLDEDAVQLVYQAFMSASASGACRLGIGVDSTTAFSGYTASAAVSTIVCSGAMYMGSPGIGFHFGAAIEFSVAGTATFFGDAGVPTNNQSALLFMGMA